MTATYSNAMSKANKEAAKCTVTYLGRTEFNVINARGVTYRVSLTGDVFKQGEPLSMAGATCSCKATKPCYHIALAYNKMLADMVDCGYLVSDQPVITAPTTPDYDSPEYQAKLAKDKADLFG